MAAAAAPPGRPHTNRAVSSGDGAPAAVSPQTGWMYVAYHDGGGRYASGPPPYEPGRQFWGRGTGCGQPAATAEDSQGVAAIDPETGKIQ